MANLSASAPESLVAAFSLNKNLQHAKLEWRYNEAFHDPRWAIAYIGAAQLEQAKKAEMRYDANAMAMRTILEKQTDANAEHARVLKSTIQESSQLVQRELQNVGAAVRENTGELRGLAAQMTQLAWLQAESNATLRKMFETIRENRANECRQLVEQGDRNFKAGYLREAEERFRRALEFDNTDFVLHQDLGLTLVQLGRLDEALEHFKKALAFPPRANAQTTNFLIARAATHAARVLYAKSDYRGAEPYFVKALQADARSAKNWYDLAVVRAQQKNTSGAIEALMYAIRLDAMLAGAALADEELAGVRSDVERLIVEETGRALREVATGTAEALRVAAGIVESVRRDAGVSIEPPSDVDAILGRMWGRGTLVAAAEAAAAIRHEAQQFRERALHLLEAARRDATQNASRDVSVANEDLERWRNARAAELDALRNRERKARQLASPWDWNIAGVFFALVGAIIGGVIGAQAHGCGATLLGIAAGFVAASIVQWIVRKAQHAAVSTDYATSSEQFQREYEARKQALATSGGSSARVVPSIDAATTRLRAMKF